MNKTYKISFILTAVVSAIYYMVKDIHQDNMSIDLGTGVILGIVATLITLVCWLYLRSEEKKYLNKKRRPYKIINCAINNLSFLKVMDNENLYISA